MKERSKITTARAIRFPNDLYGELIRLAGKNMVTFNEYVVTLLKRDVLRKR